MKTYLLTYTNTDSSSKSFRKVMKIAVALTDVTLQAIGTRMFTKWRDPKYTKCIEGYCGNSRSGCPTIQEDHMMLIDVEEIRSSHFCTGLMDCDTGPEGECALEVDKIMGTGKWSWMGHKG